MRAGNEACEHIRLIDNVGIGEEQVVRRKRHGFGKRDALQGIVEELMGNVLADNRISKLFDRDKKDKDRAKQLETRMVGELCVVAGGGDECAYDGKSMKDAHKDLGIQTADMGALVENLQAAMRAEKVPFFAQNRFLAKLAPMKRDILQEHKGRHRAPTE